MKIVILIENNKCIADIDGVKSQNIYDILLDVINEFDNFDFEYLRKKYKGKNLPENYYTAREFKKLYNVSTNTIFNYVKDGRAEKIKMNNCTYYKLKEADNVIRSVSGDIQPQS